MAIWPFWPYSRKGYDAHSSLPQKFQTQKPVSLPPISYFFKLKSSMEEPSSPSENQGAHSNHTPSRILFMVIPVWLLRKYI